MEREIKFRAWDKSLKKMWFPKDFLHGPMGVFECDVTIVGDECELMQYTGLKDKNGKEIYEGDIVKCHYFYEALGEGLGVYESEKEITGQIVFREMGLWIECESIDDSGYLLWINGLHEESFEIIGNIHQNPYYKL